MSRIILEARSNLQVQRIISFTGVTWLIILLGGLIVSTFVVSRLITGPILESSNSNSLINNSNNIYPTTGRFLQQNVTGTSDSQIFWEEPLETSQITSFNELYFDTPGPNEQVRLIVQFKKMPVSSYMLEEYGSVNNITENKALNYINYRTTLELDHERFLAEIQAERITYIVNNEYVNVLNGLAISTEMRNWEILKGFPQIQDVYPDYELEVLLVDSVPLIGAPTLWGMNDPKGNPITGSGIRVAIVDTGIDYTHPDLGGCFGESCKVIDGYDFVNDDNDPMDDFGHGTHVAGIVAANGKALGVAPEVSLLAYKACDSYGYCQMSDVLASLESAMDPDEDPLTNDSAHVVNISLGAPEEPSAIFNQAVDNAVDSGIVIVVSAGNYGTNYDSLNSLGFAENAITVAASDKNDQLASFSSRGLSRRYPEIIKPDITGPGVYISSTVPLKEEELGSPDGYLPLSGTSMSAPHISGAAALLNQLHPDWSPETIKTNLMNTAKDLGLSPYEQGTGRIQLDQAVSASMLASPASIGFGAIQDGPTSATIWVTNFGQSEIEVNASVTAHQWANGFGIILTTTTSLNYATLDKYVFNLSGNTTKSIKININVPELTSEGYYFGKLFLKSGNEIITVPFTFVLLSRINIFVLDENGDEWKCKVRPCYTQEIYLVNISDSKYNWQLSKYYDVGIPIRETIFVPSGKYNIHSAIETGHYVWGEPVEQMRIPKYLFESISAPRNSTLNVFLDASKAHRFYLDAKTYSGSEMIIGSLGVSSRYENDAVIYTWSDNITYGHWFLQGTLGMPEQLELYISETPANTDFTLYMVGYGYSPKMKSFVSLNSKDWREFLDLSRPYVGMSFLDHADELYLFEWSYSQIDESTPKEFTYLEEDTSQYEVKYDFPGIVLEPYSQFWGRISYGTECAFRYPSSFCAIRSFPAATDLKIYSNGRFIYFNLPQRDLRRRIDFFERDWSNPEQYGDLLLANVQDLRPKAPGKKTINFSSAVLYPLIEFDNDIDSIKLIQPVLGSSNGAAVYSRSESVPQLTIFKDDVTVWECDINGWNLTLSPIQILPTSGTGRYKLISEISLDSQLSYSNTIEAGFSIPANDMNPPKVLDLEIPQRFKPHQPLSVALEADDIESGVSDVEIHYSFDKGTTWTTLPITKQGSRFLGTIIPVDIEELAISFIVTDGADNYLKFTTMGASLRETPVQLDLKLSSSTFPLTSSPVSINISGNLLDSRGQTVAEPSLPITVYINDLFAGYIRNVKILEDYTIVPGVIDSDLNIIPSDFIDEAGPAELKFVFDTGTYAYQELTYIVNFWGTTFLPVISK